MQLILLNATITCMHPPPVIDAVARGKFHPSVGVLVAICILSTLMTAAVTLWVCLACQPNQVWHVHQHVENAVLVCHTTTRPRQPLSLWFALKNTLIYD